MLSTFHFVVCISLVVNSITGQDWKEALARKEPNEVVNQIRERLKNMVTYNKLREGEYACMSNGKNVGQIYREIDGDFVFNPIQNTGCYPGWMIKDIALKIEALNTPVTKE